MTHHRIFGVLLLLGAAILACASPFTAQQVDSAATAVAQTLAAVSPPAILPTPAPTQPPTPSPVPELLPHSLYYLATDQGGKLQVFRLAPDGKTVGQITFEP